MINYKILCCMSSYNRPMECICQIFRFMNMNYTNFKMSVVVRGVDDAAYEQIINNIKQFIDEQRLIIKLDKNKSHLENLMDCITNINEEFDYYAKIDDDDWYSIDYLTEINTALNSNENCDGCFISPNYITITNKTNKHITVIQNNTDLCGGSLVFNNKIKSILLDIKNNLGSGIKSIYRKYNLNALEYIIPYEYGDNEDRLIRRLIEYNSKYSEINKYNLYSIYRIYPSTMLNKKAYL